MRKEKELLLNEIKEKIDASTAMIVARYDRLEPNTSWKLRELLEKSGSLFEVVKKRVFIKAAEKSGVKIDDALLSGNIAVVFVNQPDAMVPAKAMMLIPADPRAGPIGGAGLAFPAGICSLMVLTSFFAIYFPYLSVSELLLSS